MQRKKIWKLFKTYVNVCPQAKVTEISTVFLFFLLNLTFVLSLGLINSKQKMHFFYVSCIIQRYLTSSLYFWFPVYTILIMMYANPCYLCFLPLCLCHYDCSLLKDTTMVPWSLCNYKFCNNKMIWVTGALTPHNISNSTALRWTVFLSICSVCKETVWSCVKISPLEKTVDFILGKCKHHSLKMKISPKWIAFLAHANTYAQ